MHELLWLFGLAGFLTLIMRWLLVRGLAPVNQQAIRQQFVERLLLTTEDCRLVKDEGSALTVACGPVTCTIYFEALYRRCQESPLHSLLFVRQAVQAVQQALRDEDGLPAGWEDRVMPMLMNADLPTPPNLLLRRLTESLQIGYIIDQEEAFRWLTVADLEPLALDTEQVHTLALRNLERSCNTLVIETPPPLNDGRDRLLRFHTLDGLDATRALLPSFYQRFAPRFGDVDVLVAVPTRDTLIAIPATDQAQASFLQWRADTERRRSDRPLSEQLLQITESGITEWHPGVAEADLL